MANCQETPGHADEVGNDLLTLLVPSDASNLLNFTPSLPFLGSPHKRLRLQPKTKLDQRRPLPRLCHGAVGGVAGGA